VKFDENEWFSRSQVPPTVIEEDKKLVVLESDLKLKEKTNSDLQDSSEGKEVSLPFNPIRKPR
jgi:hypothetical protein